MPYLPRALSGLLPAAGLDEMLTDLGGNRSMLTDSAVLAVPHLTWPAMASWGGHARLLAALRTRDEPLSRPGPNVGLRCRCEARPKSPILRLPTPRSRTRGTAARQRRARRGGGLLCGGAPRRVERGPAW